MREDNQGMGICARRVDLESGGYMVLSVSGDPLALDAAERAWLFELVDAFGSYQEHGSDDTAAVCLTPMPV